MKGGIISHKSLRYQIASLGILRLSCLFKYVQKHLQFLQDTEKGFNPLALKMDI